MKKALKKALFIDRDGTLIVEPPVDMQVDSLAKLEFVPGAISALKVLRGLDFELVMATNQDGLGTDSFPEEDFRIPQEKMLRTLAGTTSRRVTSSATARPTSCWPAISERGEFCSHRRRRAAGCCAKPERKSPAC